MKQLSILIILLSLTIQAQNFSPKILVLETFQKNVDTIFSKEISKYNMRIISSIEYDQETIKFLKLGKSKKNEILMDSVAYFFLKNQNFYSTITVGISNMLVYRFYNWDSNCLIYPSHITSDGTLEDYKEIADKFDMNWVVNPIKIYSSNNKVDGIFTEITIQLYNRELNRIVLDKTFKGTSENPGFTWTCDEGSFNCTTNNAQSRIIDAVVNEIR